MGHDSVSPPCLCSLVQVYLLQVKYSHENWKVLPVWKDLDCPLFKEDTRITVAGKCGIQCCHLVTAVFTVGVEQHFNTHRHMVLPQDLNLVANGLSTPTLQSKTFTGISITQYGISGVLNVEFFSVSRSPSLCKRRE